MSGPIRDHQVIHTLQSEVGEEMVTTLLQRFYEDLSEHLQSLQKALNEGDTKLLELESHTLKSISETFGAVALNRVMKDVNEACRSGRTRRAFEQARLDGLPLGQETLAAFARLPKD